MKNENERIKHTTQKSSKKSQEVTLITVLVYRNINSYIQWSGLTTTVTVTDRLTHFLLLGAALREGNLTNCCCCCCCSLVAMTSG